MVNKVYQIFNESQNKILSTNYFDKVEFECLITSDNVVQIISELKNATNGNIAINLIEMIYF